jgi:AcrR family transcriptional regulator
MTDPSPRRLSKADRREQLLETALAVVRAEGTDALTLGHLAERAGVSKPIAYEHFKTRARLLMALYEQLDQHHAAALRRALGQTRRRLADVARVASAAYFDCYETLGPEWLAISAALHGADETDAFQRQSLEANVALYCNAFAPYTQHGSEELRLLCVALIGAAEAITRELDHGRIDRSDAEEMLAGLIVRALRK